MAINQTKRRGALAGVKFSSMKDITKFILHIWWEFCSFTSLHGMRNLVSDIRHLKRPSTGKRFSRKQRIAAVTMSSITWGGAFIVGAAFAITMITLIWQRFQATPTITTVDTYYYPIWNVPFPAVTICNINQVYRPATKNIERKLLAYGVKQTNVDHFFKGLAGLVKPPYHSPTGALLNVSNIVEKMGYTTETLLREVMQPCDKMISTCSWLNKDAPCEQLFKVSKGSEGFCCSFNYHPLENGTQRDKYLRVSGAGEYVGLKYLLSPEVEHYVSYTVSFYGFYTMIHFPGDFVDMPPDAVIIQPGYLVNAMITPSAVETDAAVRWLPLEQRKCRFPSEYSNHSFLYDQYRHSSCIVKCRLTATLERCLCIPFYYPHIKLEKYREFRQCSLRDSPCLRNVRSLIASLQVPKGTPGFETHNDTGLACDCMPGCSEQRYDTQYMFADRERAPRGALRFSGNVTISDMRNHTLMSVAFKSPTCIKYRRSLYMTWDGFFASFGGIFGLCLGGSIVSLVELVYFCVVRIFGRIILPTEQMASGPPHSPPLKLKRNTDRSEFTVTRIVDRMKSNDSKEIPNHSQSIEMKDFY